MRSRLVRAEAEMGADLMALVVASCMYFGISLGPSDWLGHAGEKWSFGMAQHGHMNQWEEWEFLGFWGEAGEGKRGDEASRRLLTLWMRELLDAVGVEMERGFFRACGEHLLRASDRNACSLLKPMKSFLV